MSSSDPALRSQRLALLESYLNGTAFTPNVPNFSNPSTTQNQLPSLRSSDLQNVLDHKKSSNPPTLPSLNEFIKPIIHSTNQSSSDSSPPFHAQNIQSNGPSHNNNFPSRHPPQSNNNSSNMTFSVNEQNRGLAHRNAPSPGPGMVAPSLSILAHAATPVTDPHHEYQHKDSVDNLHRYRQYSHANATNNNQTDESLRRMMSGYGSMNNTANINGNPSQNSHGLYQPSHHHNLQDSSQAYHNPNMHSHRFHTSTNSAHNVPHSSSSSSAYSSGSSSSSSSGSSSDTSGIYHNFEGGMKSLGESAKFSELTQAVSPDQNMPQAKERVEEKRVSSQGKLEDNINMMQMLLNTPGSFVPDSESFTENLLDIYTRFHNAESSRLLPAVLAPTQNLHNNSTTPMDTTIEPRATHVNSSS